MKKLVRWIRTELGLYRNSKYETQYLNETNIRTAIYMSIVVISLEIWMLIRYVDKRPGLTFLEYFDGWTNYLILLSSAAISLTFAIRFRVRENAEERKKSIAGIVVGLLFLLLDILMFVRFVHVRKNMSFGDLFDESKYLIMLTILICAYLVFEFFFSSISHRSAAIYGQFLNVIFALICLGFGIETSVYDVSKERQILCFVTMVIYAACLLIWKPYVSIIILSVSFTYFYKDWKPIMEAYDSPYAQKILEANQINYLTFWIALTMVSISIYQQRLSEAKKDENLVAANKHLRKLAVEDELTGISNIYQFVQDAEEVMINTSEPRIYLFINIENFKNYNDQFGYLAGNIFLKKIARLIKKTFEDCPVARQAYDHFVVLAHVDGVTEKVNSLREQVISINTDIYIDVNVGSYTPQSEMSESTVLTSQSTSSEQEMKAAGKMIDPRIAIDRARFACSLLKHKYDKHYMEYDSKINSDFHKRQYIVNNIDNAVEKGYIKVYYQPVVWSESHTLCGCEALARWDDPKYGFLSPADFIPVLEEYRQIHKLDKCIWETVCRDIQNVSSQGMHPIPVSLNFSRLDFELMDTATVLEELVEKYKVNKHDLHIEITESALTDDMGVLQSSINKLKEDGFSLWLDDFGSGYSSLNVLKDYSFDVLKIDMNFLSSFDSNEKSKIILNMIIDLASSLGMYSLTEGVETEEEADFLARVGCGRLQGYYFGKPMPLDQIIEKINNGTYVIKRLV